MRVCEYILNSVVRTIPRGETAGNAKPQPFRFVSAEGLCDSVARLQALSTWPLQLDFKRSQDINSGCN